MRQILMRFLKKTHRYDIYRDHLYSIPLHEFNRWRLELLGYEMYINFSHWKRVIKNIMPTTIKIAIPNNEAEMNEMIEYFTKNGITWHSGATFIEFLETHKRLDLPSMSYIVYDRIGGRLTWSNNREENLMPPQKFYQLFESLKASLDLNAKEIFFN